MTEPSEYTPTTEAVREAYPHASILPPFYDPRHVTELKERLAEFDRWLAEHDAQVYAAGVAAERERVRRLVDPVLDRWKDHIGTHCDECHLSHVACLAAAIREGRT